MTNKTRNYWDKEVSPLCSFCKEQDETITHLMYDCKKTNVLWKALKKWIQYFFEIPIELPVDIVILNNYTGQQQQMINTIILVIKQYIYAAKCTGNDISFNMAMSKVHQLYLDETAIAQEQSKMHKNVQKWGEYVRKIQP